MLDDPDIKDQFAIPYPLGTPLKIPAVNEDPGRIRNEALFAKAYGDCRKGEVTKRLKPVTWLPDRGGGTVMVTTVNGVADRLADVARSLANAARRDEHGVPVGPKGKIPYHSRRASLRGARGPDRAR
jgi:hypothetical protein